MRIHQRHPSLIPAVVAYATSKPATTSQALPLIDLGIVVTAVKRG
jgi:hypothetical protein